MSKTSLETIDYCGEKIKKWRIGAATYLAWPERGARLMNWNLILGDGNVRDIIYWPEIESLENPAKIRGGNPILFPFSGRCFSKEKENFWTDPDGKEREMPRHGFAKDGKFEIIDIEENGFTAQLIPTAADKEVYPYDFEFQVIYRFQELSFSVEFRLINLGDKIIPWSAGHHFYFQLPWHENTTRENYQITIPAKKAYYHAPDGRLQRVKNFDTVENFANTKIIDRIHSELKENTVRFGPKSGEEDIEISVGTNPVPPKHATIVTWTEKSSSPFYCVEPWMSPPNSPAHKNGLNFVDPKKTGVFSVEVKLV